MRTFAGLYGLMVYRIGCADMLKVLKGVTRIKTVVKSKDGFIELNPRLIDTLLFLFEVLRGVYDCNIR